MDAEARGKFFCLCRGSNPGLSVRSHTLRNEPPGLELNMNVVLHFYHLSSLIQMWSKKLSSLHIFHVKVDQLLCTKLEI
jgi:hypothetical protein